jgi:hypothetical protein
MLALMQGHFEGVTPAVFERDLADKNWALLIEEGGLLKGFSTLHVAEASAAGETFTLVYSGDTIMERAAWGSPVLARSWIGAIQQLCGERPGQRTLWLLLTSGFRTYRFLPVFWREFYPRHDGAFEDGLRTRLEQLAASRFGAQYRREAGIVHFVQPQRLRGELQNIPTAKAEDPHVAFFLERNPQWAAGDELACLTELCFANLTPAGRRMWTAAARERALVS